jgi:hypothetical protein
VYTRTVSSKDPGQFLPTKIKLASKERSKHRRVVALKFTIKTQVIPKVSQCVEL